MWPGRDWPGCTRRHRGWPDAEYGLRSVSWCPHLYVTSTLKHILPGGGRGGERGFPCFRPFVLSSLLALFRSFYLVAARVAAAAAAAAAVAVGVWGVRVRVRTRREPKTVFKYKLVALNVEVIVDEIQIHIHIQIQTNTSTTNTSNSICPVPSRLVRSFVRVRRQGKAASPTLPYPALPYPAMPCHALVFVSRIL